MAWCNYSLWWKLVLLFSHTLLLLKKPQSIKDKLLSPALVLLFTYPPSFTVQLSSWPIAKLKRFLTPSSSFCNRIWWGYESHDSIYCLCTNTTLPWQRAFVFHFINTYQRNEADNTYVKANVLECGRQWVGVHRWYGQQPCRNIHNRCRHKSAYYHAWGNLKRVKQK